MKNIILLALFTLSLFAEFKPASKESAQKLVALYSTDELTDRLCLLVDQIFSNVINQKIPAKTKLTAEQQQQITNIKVVASKYYPLYRNALLKIIKEQKTLDKFLIIIVQLKVEEKTINTIIPYLQQKEVQSADKKSHIMIAKILKEGVNLLEPLVLLFSGQSPEVLQLFELIKKIVNTPLASFQVPNSASDSTIQELINLSGFSSEMYKQILNSTAQQKQNMAMVNLFANYKKISTIIKKIIKETYTEEEVKASITFYKNPQIQASIKFLHSKEYQEFLQKYVTSEKFQKQIESEFLPEIKSLETTLRPLNKQFKKEYKEIINKK